MVDSVLQDATIARAVSNIKPRAERQPDLATLERTYVETGVLPQLANGNNQIVYGRRGTGKSHLLRVLGAESAGESEAVLYIDIRLLGSAQLMADDSRPLTVRCVSVFRDLLSAMQSQLLDVATDPARDGSGLEEVSEFADAVTQKAREVTGIKITETEHVTNKDDAGVELRLSANPSVGMHAGGGTEGGASKVTEYQEAVRDTVVFAEVSNVLDRALAALGVDRLTVLIDEWTAIPAEVQPYIAEFLRRTFFPSNRITVKIASLEYRSRFSTQVDGSIIGFELGPDITANLDLDEYYVYDRNPEHVVRIFLDLLMRHVQSELEDGYLESLGVTSTESFRARFFTEPATFDELVRAGEGVVRDFLGIFSSAYFRAQRSGRQRVDLNSVEEAARDWFETDKSTSLSEDQQRALNLIMTEVIGNRQAKMFMLAREHSRHPMIESLFDQRIIHLTSRGYSDKENPGLRYNIYSLDYGTYVDLKRTRREPEGLTLFDEGEVPTSDEQPTGDRVVPFPDKRSIRRVILDPAIFDAE